MQTPGSLRVKRANDQPQTGLGSIDVLRILTQPKCRTLPSPQRPSRPLTAFCCTLLQPLLNFLDSLQTNHDCAPSITIPHSLHSPDLDLRLLTPNLAFATTCSSRPLFSIKQSSTKARLQPHTVDHHRYHHGKQHCGRQSSAYPTHTPT